MEMEKRKRFSLVIQDRVLRDILGYRRDEVAGDWRRLHSEDIRDLYCLPNIIQVIISRRTKCVGLWRGWGRDIFWFLVGKLEVTNHLEVPSIDEMIILN